MVHDARRRRGCERVAVTAQTPAARRAPERPPPRIRSRQPAAIPDGPQTVETTVRRCASTPMFKGLAAPWSLAFLPNGDMLITEKAGKLRIVRGGTLDPQPIAGTPEVFAAAGRTSRSRRASAVRAEPVHLPDVLEGKEKEGTTALARGRFDGKALVDVKDIFVADNWNTGGIHFGSKLAFGKDGMLYMTVGERNDARARAEHEQPWRQGAALKDDGTVPADNPFVGKSGFKPRSTATATAICRARGASRNRRALGNRTRAAGRRRAEPGAAGQELRLAGRDARARVQRRSHQRAAGARGHRAAVQFWAPSPGLRAW
jgi:glucose/arabinose dehydrogenase